MACRKRKDVIAKAAMDMRLDAYGLTEEAVVSKIVELMSATTMRQGVGEVADNNVQLGATKVAADIRGLIQKQQAVNVTETITNLVVISMEKEEAQKAVDTIDYEVLEKSYLNEEDTDTDDG